MCSDRRAGYGLFFLQARVNGRTIGSVCELETARTWADEWVAAVLVGKVALHHESWQSMAGAILHANEGPTLCITIHNLVIGGEIETMTPMRRNSNKDSTLIRNYFLSTASNAERSWQNRSVASDLLA
jgi:hypothetical protein